nr:AIR synthase related protein [Candidatus Sigynarchaeum springense]
MENKGHLTERPGKLSGTSLKSTVLEKLGLGRVDVMYQPGPGRDFNVIKLPGKERDVILVTTDPLYVNPEFGIEDATWLGFHIAVTDMLVSGVKPEYALFTLTLPDSIEPGVFEQMWSAIANECRRMGIAIVGGHTGSYDGCAFPMIGASTMMARSRIGQYITVDTLKAGDDIVLANPPGMEAIASLLKVDERNGRDEFGARYEAIKRQCWSQLSVEKPVEAAREIMIRTGMWGGESISAMHDVAERGVLGAVNDWCEATGLGCSIGLDGWPFDPSMAAFIKCHFPDPADIWAASGQGGVIMGCRPSLTSTLLGELQRSGVPSRKIGTMKAHGSPRTYTIGGSMHNFPAEIKDPFWPAFTKVARAKN